MAVLINFKICDNAEECNGIEECPTGALSWDAGKKTIAIDNSKCTSCGRCEPACMVGAIRVARNGKEFARFKKEIDEDPRRIEDLFVDRYGAEVVDPAFVIPEGRFDKEVLRATKLTAVELFSEDSIECLLHSIPVKELFSGFEIKFRKAEAGKGLMERFGISKLPAMLFFRDGRLLGKIEGYIGIEEIGRMKLLMQRIIC